MNVREAAALRRAEEFKRYYPLTDGDGELVYEYFLAHVTHEGLDGAPEIMRRDGAVSDVEFERGKSCAGSFSRVLKRATFCTSPTLTIP